MPFARSSMQLTSSAFEALGRIPTTHTGEGEDISPVLAWSGAPANARAFALVCHDPDAPLLTPRAYGWVHWVLYNIPASVTTLAEGESGYTCGTNEAGNARYNGPMPPEGHGLHHYYFWLMALDTDTKLPAGLSMVELFAAIEPHVIAMNRLVGVYSRPA